MPCQCPIAGYCERHGINKSRRLHELCQMGGKYWLAWELGKGPLQRRPLSDRRRRRQPRGVGTFIKLELRAMGHKAFRGCSCKDRTKAADAWGPDECERRIATIVDWLHEAMRGAGPWHKMVATAPIGKQLARWQIRELVRRAIARAREDVRKYTEAN